MPGIGQVGLKCGENLRERLFQHQHFGRGIRENEKLFGDRQPPVQRHQHGAEPGAGIEQHQVIRPVQAEDRNAVATGDTEHGPQCPRGLFDTAHGMPRS